MFGRDGHHQRGDDGCSDCWFGRDNRPAEAVHIASFLGVLSIGLSAVPSPVLGRPHVAFQGWEERGKMNTTMSNKPDAVNPAIASRLHVLHHWRGVTDPDRSAFSRAPFERTIYNFLTNS